MNFARARRHRPRSTVPSGAPGIVSTRACTQVGQSFLPESEAGHHAGALQEGTAAARSVELSRAEAAREILGEFQLTTQAQVNCRGSP